VEYYAHNADNGRRQTVIGHLRNTSALCAEYADAFDAEQQGRLIGLAHDIGKCSLEFQERLRGGQIVDHASAGALECAKQDAEWAACCVAGHHGGLPDVGNLTSDSSDSPTLYGRLRKAIGGGIPAYEMPLSLPRTKAPHGYGKDMLVNSYIIRMLYSCLVDADYLDTERFMSDGEVERGTGEPLPQLLNKLECYIEPWWKPTNDLNERRCKILKACMDGGEKPRGIYTLTVPTGGGKTVASMAFALRHAVQNGMQRIIYVIPYTSIIEQTADVFRGIFGEENVVEHHSNASYEVDEGGSAAQYRLARATENWDAPIIVTTAVQFFESLYANRPSKCRKLHNIANSVMIFDEAQMLPTAHLRPCVAAIAELAAHFRSTAVLCTATQPVLNDMFNQYAPGISINELCPNPSELFSQFRRVKFENIGAVDTDALAAQLAERQQVLCIVNSRKAAQEIYRELPQEGGYHLSTLMYPAHRRTVLAEIRHRLKDGLPCRVVSTSLIEAGVDVDFPAVYREMAGLDSILQAAGRCNREGKRNSEESIVTIFEGVSVAPQMLKINIGAAKETLTDSVDLTAPETVERYFRAYRSLMQGASLDQAGVISAFENGISGCQLPFRTVAERFHLIDDDTKTVYIPEGEGANLVKRLRDGEHTRSLFRKLGQYGVNLYDRQFQELLDSGSLELLEDGSAILTDLSRYVLNMGLVLRDNQNTGFFA